MLDNLLFPNYRNVKVKAPVFIIGNPRSGSTLLHRTLASDTKNFSTMTAWDIYVAPSILQKKITKTIAALDLRLLSGILHRFLHEIDRRSFGKVSVHATSLFSPEEDEGLFLHIWDSHFLSYLFPDTYDASPQWKFDDLEDSTRKEQVMQFYKAMIQRHLYVHPNTVFLSKNPVFSGRIVAIKSLFPDAKFVYLYREPLTMLPSAVSWATYAQQIFGSVSQPAEQLNTMLFASKYWYTHPLHTLQTLPTDQVYVVSYDTLISHTKVQLDNLYDRFGYENVMIWKSFNKHARAHSYSYASLGLDRTSISAEYEGISDSIKQIKQLVQ